MVGRWNGTCGMVTTFSSPHIAWSLPMRILKIRDMPQLARKYCIRVAYTLITPTALWRVHMCEYKVDTGLNTCCNQCTNFCDVSCTCVACGIAIFFHSWSLQRWFCTSVLNYIVFHYPVSRYTYRSFTAGSSYPRNVSPFCDDVTMKTSP
jgi:hypothetical protein